MPYNIPGMNTLAAELKDFLGANPYKNPDSKKAVHEFIENLNHGMGLEKALLNTKATDEVENDIVCKVWNLIDRKFNIELQFSCSNELYEQEMIDDEPYSPSSNNTSSIWGN